jgi:hypothetical protein
VLVEDEERAEAGAGERLSHPAEAIRARQAAQARMRGRGR